MSDKPSYLGLLNAIAVAESHACEYLTAWADTTPSPDVRKVLLTVAAREGEHGMSFAKRINELGYEVRHKDDPNQAKTLELVRSSRSDLKKFEKLKLHELDTGEKPDIFDGFFKDHSIDIRTGELLGRYISEERDSARRFRSCYEQLAAAGNGTGEATSDSIQSLETKVDMLCRAVDELRQIVVAQAMPASTRKSRAAS